MEKFGSMVHHIFHMEELKSVLMVHGELCVDLTGMKEMQVLCADNLDLHLMVCS